MKPPDTPPSIPSLLTQLGPERLGEFALNPKRYYQADRYLHWDELRHRPPPDGLNHEEWWLYIKLGRVSQARSLPFTNKHGQPFSYVLTESVLKTLRHIDRFGGGSDYLGNPNIDPGESDRYLLNLLMEESITSSQIEGASTTRRAAVEMLRSGRGPKDISERMIWNNFAAMRYIQQTSQTPLTPETLCQLHAIVTRGTLDNPQEEGCFRADNEVKVVDARDGTILHIPPEATQLPGRMEALCHFANQSEADEPYCHPVIRAILLHFMLAYDHPFADGNGRSARALFYWSMVRQGYSLMEYVSISSVLRKATGQYMRAYLHTETDGGDTTYFILYQLKVIELALQELRQYLQRKQTEMEETRQQLGTLKDREKLNLRQLALLGSALKGRTQRYTIDSHQRSHNTAYATAREDLLHLARLGLLEQVKEGRTLVYYAPENLLGKIARIRQEILTSPD